MDDCFKNDFSRGLARHQNGAGAYSGREIEAIAQTVGEEQLRGGEGRVIGRNPQSALGVALQAMHHVMVRVDSCFWPARAARRVQPEGWIVSPGGSGRRLGHGTLEVLLEASQARSGMAIADPGRFKV